MDARFKAIHSLVQFEWLFLGETSGEIPRPLHTSIKQEQKQMRTFQVVLRKGCLLGLTFSPARPPSLTAILTEPIIDPR